MQLRLNPKSARTFSWGKLAIKTGLTLIVILAIVFFLGQLKLSAPKKLIQQEISNDKLIKLK